MLDSSKTSFTSRQCTICPLILQVVIILCHVNCRGCSQILVPCCENENFCFGMDLLPKFRFLPCIDSLLTIGDRHLQKVAATSETAQSQSANSLPFCMEQVPFHVGCLFCMTAYKCNVVVVFKMGTYSWGVNFVWVLIIPILWYCDYHHTHST